MTTLLVANTQERPFLLSVNALGVQSAISLAGMHEFESVEDAGWKLAELGYQIAEGPDKGIYLVTPAEAGK